MKKAILVIGLVFAAITTIGFTSDDQDKVPQVVKDAFAQKFPTAEKVDWDKESATEWEGEFKMNTLEYSANFLEDGTWKETEHKIDKAEIPQVVITALRSNFPGYEIEETEMAETPQGTVYEFEIEKGKTEMEVTIDPNGKVLKKQMEAEEADDND